MNYLKIKGLLQLSLCGATWRTLWGLKIAGNVRQNNIPYLKFLDTKESKMVCVCVCVRYDGLGPVLPYTHTHHGFKITLPNTDQAHDKHP